MTKITSVCNLNVMKEDAGMPDHLDIDGTIELKEGISKEKAIETIEETSERHRGRNDPVAPERAGPYASPA